MNTYLKIEYLANQMKFLLHKQRNNDARYNKIYANGNGAMHYSFLDINNVNTANVLIGDKFQEFRSLKLAPQQYGPKQKDFLNFEQIGEFLFDIGGIHLNQDNSFCFSENGIDHNFEINKNFKTQGNHGRHPKENMPQIVDILPNQMIARLDLDPLSFSHTILDLGKESPILTNIETVQKLDYNCNRDTNSIVLHRLAKEEKIDDLYIVDFGATNEMHTFALKRIGYKERDQKTVDAYKARYKNVVDLLLPNTK